MDIRALTDDLAGQAHWLAAAEALHRQLRPALQADYAAQMHQMFGEGAEMVLLTEGAHVCAIAVYRCLHTTFQGYRCYLDDLVTDERQRARGHGATLMAWCEQRARDRGCDTLALDSGVQRGRTHSFYFRHGYTIAAFGFTKSLRTDQALSSIAGA